MGQSGIVATQGPVGGQIPIESLGKSESEISKSSIHTTSESTHGRSFTDSTRACSSPLAHIITALVLAIVVGAAAAAASYFLAGQNILYTALAGASGFVGAGLVTYLMMRIFLSGPDVPPPEDKPHLSHH